MSFLLFLCPIIDYRPHYLPNKKKKEKKKKKRKMVERWAIPLSHAGVSRHN